jgi:hypothetical protein
MMRRGIALACAAASALLACRTGAGSVQPDGAVPTPIEAGIDDGGTPLGNTDAPQGPLQVDRAGHPLVSVLLVPPSLQDQYNALSSFAPNVPRVLQEGLASRLASFDTIRLGDGGADQVDWTVDGGTHPLLSVYVKDFLLVDTALSCTSPDGGFVSSYLEIERESFLGGPTHTTCGGRTPNENIVDETLALLITADRDGGPAITQGVSGPTKWSTTSFPYLAEPNGGDP